MRVEEGTGFKPTPCPPEEDQEKPGTPAVSATPTSGSTPTPTPTPTPNPCPSECFDDNDARFIRTFLGRAEAHYHQGNYQAALADLEIALKLAQNYGDDESAEIAQDMIDAIR